MTAAGLDYVPDGRFRLGIGTLRPTGSWRASTGSRSTHRWAGPARSGHLPAGLAPGEGELRRQALPDPAVGRVTMPVHADPCQGPCNACHDTPPDRLSSSHRRHPFLLLGVAMPGARRRQAAAYGVGLCRGRRRRHPYAPNVGAAPHIAWATSDRGEQARAARPHGHAICEDGARRRQRAVVHADRAG